MSDSLKLARNLTLVALTLTAQCGMLAPIASGQSSSAPLLAPTRLARPGAPADAYSATGDSDKLSGRVSQSSTLNSRLTRDSSADSGASTLVTAPAPSKAIPATSTGQSLFSDADKNAFAAVPLSASPAANTSNRPAVTPAGSMSNNATATTGSSEMDTLRKGLKMLSGLEQNYRNSPALQSGARALMGNITGGGRVTRPATPLTGSANASQSRPGVAKFVGRVLNKQELATLSNYEVVVIIDKSGSMNEDDCPGNLTRWEWCNQQLASFTAQTAAVFRSGITVALFSSDYQVFRNVDFSMVSTLFSKTSPNGGTYMARPLSEVLDEYFERRDHSPSSVRKLLIEVISDGEPSDRGEVIATISRASRRLNRPDEVRINFIQIGNERDGITALAKFDNGLVGQEGASYDIVSVSPFAQVAQGGLPGAMADAARR